MSTLYQAVRTFNQRRATEAALHNEQLTRQRVERIERMIWPSNGRPVQVREMSLHERLVLLEALKVSRFWGRMRWLFLGR